jgi:carotenoid cleavage dioxygenase
MKATVHARFPCLLPRDDDHPYRTGAWRPQVTEWDASELDVVGEIPQDLAGVYLRNTENPLIAAGPLYHPFDGDGMLHAIAFRDGTASYRNSLFRTVGIAA